MFGKNDEWLGVNVPEGHQTVRSQDEADWIVVRLLVGDTVQDRRRHEEVALARGKAAGGLNLQQLLARRDVGSYGAFCKLLLPLTGLKEINPLSSIGQGFQV